MTPDRTDRTAEFLVRVAEDAVLNNRVGRWIGMVAAILLALTAAAMANDVIF